MPLYEYYCEKCDKVFEALRSIRESAGSAPCPDCGGEAQRIMPTTFASMSFKQGYSQRVPFHHRPVRSLGEKPRTIAPVKGRTGRKGAKAKAREGEG